MSHSIAIVLFPYELDIFGIWYIVVWLYGLAGLDYRKYRPRMVLLQ